jgi:multicomponent Na+:H+ antiporter subunit G
MSLLELITVLVTAIGVFFMAVSSIGLVRLPDLYTRVHAAGKAGTLGIVGVLLGVGIYYAADQNFPVMLRMLALIAFFFLTAPVAAHMLDRAAFLTGVKPIETTRPNELEGRYDPETRRLRS